jgi:hypothetical protein
LPHISTEEATKRKKTAEIDLFLIQISALKKDTSFSDEDKLAKLREIEQKIVEVQKRR